MNLTDLKIKALKPETKTKKYFDGQGLFLEVPQLEVNDGGLCTASVLKLNIRQLTQVYTGGRKKVVL